MTACHAVSADPPASSAAILLNVCARYGSRRILEDLSLAFDPGEITVLLGPNGSGKTSLIRVLTGKLAVESGTLRLPGAAHAAVALVPQDLALYAWLTASENCRAFARLDGVPRAMAPERAAAALAAVGCLDVADVPVARLSGGYKRRVNVAAALVRQPRLLILDEATVGIDREARKAIAEALSRLRAGGAAILMVTHDLDEAGALADRVAFLRAGRLVAQGEPRALVHALHAARKEIQIDLAAEPDAGQREHLRGRGAAPSGNARNWLTYRDLADWDVRGFLADLGTVGIDVREVRLRDPGVSALYAHYCGPAAAA